MQFLIWLGRVLHGDFGMSIADPRPVLAEVFGALANTAHARAVRGAARRSSSATCMGARRRLLPRAACIDRVVTGTAVFGVSLPNYWLGMVLVIVFAVELVRAAGDRHGASGSAEFNVLRWGDAKYLILPVITLAMMPIGIIARTTRAAVAEVLQPGFRHDVARQGPGRGRGASATC